MIGKLRGKIDSVRDDAMIVDVGGVGYLVFASQRTLRQVNDGQDVNLLIETHVREDHIHLYGFTHELERYWFNVLTSQVKGIGTRMALAVLSALSPDQIVEAIATQDRRMFTQVSGIGPKLADRMLTELKGKDQPVAAAAGAMPKAAAGSSGAQVLDAVSALVNLGYNKADAQGVIAKLAREEKDIPLQDLIRKGLKELA